MKFAYADPPYPGMAHLYKDHPDYGGEVDHKSLIERLVAEYPDGWALSTASTTLKQVLLLCPDDVRIMCWLKPGSNGYFPPNRLRYGWEPVILSGGRPPAILTDDYHSSPNLSGFLSRNGDVIGRKPNPFCFWLFRCLGALPGDTLDDLFPGSGAVSRAWEKYQRQMSYFVTDDDYSGKEEKLPI